MGKICKWTVVAALAVCPLTAQAQDASPALPLAPVPVVPSSPPANSPPELVPPPAAAQTPAPAPSPLPPPGPGPVYVPPPGPGYVPLPPPPLVYPYPEPRRPWLDQPPAPLPGFVFNLDFDLVGVHIRNHLQAPVVTDSSGTAYLVQLPGASLDWTGSPRFELGYRFPQGCGEFLISYRFLGTEGRDTLAGFDLDGSDVPLHSRLNMNVVDLDYATPEFSPIAHWKAQGRIGARIATVYFDSLANGYYIDAESSNNYVGGGPHFGLDAWRLLDVPGLAFFTRLDGAVLFGRVHQSYELDYVNPDGSVSGGATDVNHTQTVPILSFLAGLSWTPCRYHWSRYSLGYVIEQWWDVGHAGASNADLISQGLFIRAEFTF
jgi:hypothetical protein